MTAVSVILPVYNGAAFVAGAVESALAQTHADREIIAVDDGSTDDTPAVLARFGSAIRVVRIPHSGLSAARNAGIAAAHASVLALLDADDLWEPTCLASGVARLTACDPSVVGVFGGWVLADRSGTPFAHTETIRRGRFGIRELLQFNPFPPSTVLLRRAPVVAAGGFDETLAAVEDWELWLRLTVAGAVFVALEACVCRYRVHDQNWSHDPARMHAGALRAAAKLFDTAALPADLAARRSEVIAHIHARASAGFYAVGRPIDAVGMLRDAIAAWPDILLDDETYWSIICAEQPRGWKATPHQLDLTRGEQHIIAALTRSAEQTRLAPPLRRRAFGRAYRALAQLAVGQRRFDQARAYALRALRSDPVLCADPGTIGPLAKSFVGAKAIDRVRAWRRTVSRRS
jgi:GT2 family glycosyltransferase